MHWSEWNHSKWDCSCFLHKAVQAKTKKIYVPSCYLVSQQIFFLPSKCTFSLPSSSLIPIRSHNANMILPKSTWQESYWYFSYSCQGVSYDFPCQGWGGKQTQECKKTSSRGVQLRWQLRWICNSEIKADDVFQHLYPWFPPPQKQFAPTFHQSVFVRGGRASEHPELWPDFVNPLLLNLQRGSTKNNPNSKTTGLWWAEFMLLSQKIPLIAQTCSFSPKAQKNSSSHRRCKWRQSSTAA